MMAFPLWSLVVVISLTCSVKVAKAVSVPSSHSIEDDYGYPLHDAMVAAGFESNTNRLDLVTMKEVLKCSSDDSGTLNDFEAAIPTLIEQAMAKKDRDVGRIVETASDTFNVGSNYELMIETATVACLVHRPRNENIGTAAHASHLLSFSETDVNLEDPDPSAYDLAMLLEADVMELPVGGFLFVPKRNCLDLRNALDVGIGNGGDNSRPVPTKTKIDREINTGAGFKILTSTLNRITWLDTQPNDSEPNIVTRAYAQPKVEIKAIADADNPDHCRNETYTDAVFLDCVTEVAKARLQERGVQVYDFGLSLAGRQYQSMLLHFRDWLNEKYKVYKVLDSEQAEKLVVRKIVPVTPPLFDRAVAHEVKTSYFFRGTPVNPYLTQEEMNERVVEKEGLGETVAKCVLGEKSIFASTAVFVTALTFPSALRRRLNERSPNMPPGDRPKDWSHYNENFSIPSQLEGLGLEVDLFFNASEKVLEMNADYLDQSIAWTQRGTSNEYDLEEGNLTNRILGRTARWIMTSRWDINGLGLQNHLRDLLESNLVSRTAPLAVDASNPCGNAASDSDIVLFVLTMVLAAFGAVDAVVGRARAAGLWWRYDAKYYRFNRYKKQQESPHKSKLMDPAEDSRAMRLGLALLGVVSFGALYIPVMIQIVKELEVAGFETKAVNMEVLYASDDGTDGSYNTLDASRSKPVFVSLVHAQTQCESERSSLLIILFVIGVVVGLVMNAHFFLDTVPCCFRSADGEESNRHDVTNVVKGLDDDSDSIVGQDEESPMVPGGSSSQDRPEDLEDVESSTQLQTSKTVEPGGSTAKTGDDGDPQVQDVDENDATDKTTLVEHVDVS